MIRIMATLAVLSGVGCGAVFGLDELPADRDRDFVNDSEDRCEGFDDRLDEDDDGVPDACDNCPETENAGQENSDVAYGDDVGDACDPDPPGACTIDTRALFDGFNRSDFGEWALGTGDWAMTYGEMVQSSVSGRNFAHIPRISLLSSVARVRFRLIGLSPEDEDKGLVVGVNTRPGGTEVGSGYFCFADARGTNHKVVIRRRSPTGQEDWLDDQAVSGRFAIDGLISIVAQSDRSPLERCTAFQRDPAAAAQLPATANEGTLSEGEPMVLTDRASAAIMAVDVIAIGAACP